MTHPTTTLLRISALACLTLHCSSSIGEEDVVDSGSGGAGDVAAPSATGGVPGGGSGVGGSGLSASGGDFSTTGGDTAAGGLGSGGASATGGAASGGAASGGAASGGATGACPVGVAFCDDFESFADKTAPSAPKWKSWTVGAGTVLVDSDQAYSGSKAAHFHGRVSQARDSKEQAFMLAEGAPSFPIPGTTAFVRFMMYGARFPFTGVSSSNHIDIAWIGSSKALNSPDQGVTGEAYMLADYNGVAIQPMWSGYYRNTSTHFKDASQANAWHCWEFQIDNENGPPSGQKGTALPHIWEDGVELKLSPAGSGATYGAISFEAVMFSLWSPQTDTAAADYWIDDVAVSSTRIHCPPAK